MNFPATFPELTTERLILRQIMPEDDNEIYFQRSDRSMNEYVDNPLCQSIEEARQWIEKVNNGIPRKESIAWGVCIKGEPRLVGGFCFWNFAAEEEKAEIGFGIYPGHQNKGFMHEILQTTLKYGFEALGLQCIEAYTNPGNRNAIRLLEKNNFTLRKEQPESEPNYIVFELFKNRAIS
jgi:ribosomal-protein-alanine N-acetyltransferase